MDSYKNKETKTMKKVTQKVLDARRGLIPILSQSIMDHSKTILEKYPDWLEVPSDKPGQTNIVDGSGELTAIVIDHMGYAKEIAREISLNLTKIKDIPEYLNNPESFIPAIYTDSLIKDKLAELERAKQNRKKADKLIQKRKKLYAELEKLDEQIRELI